MESKTVTVETTLQAPVERVWQALTNKDEMTQWYFTLDDFKPEVGFHFSFKGQGHKGELYIHMCTITEVVPPKKLQYSWAYKSYPGHSFVTFELFDKGNSTILRLTHSGLETFPQDNPDFASSSFNEGWNMIIGKMLPEYLAGK